MAGRFFAIIMSRPRAVASGYRNQEVTQVERAHARKKYRKLIAYRVRSIRFANSLEKYSITARLQGEVWRSFSISNTYFCGLWTCVHMIN